VSTSSVCSGPNVPKPAFVHQHGDGRAAVVAARFDGRELVGFGEIRGKYLRARPERAFELLGERFEPAAVTRDEHEVMTAFGEEPRQALADPRRRTGDERDGSRHAAGMVVGTGFAVECGLYFE